MSIESGFTLHATILLRMKGGRLDFTSRVIGVGENEIGQKSFKKKVFFSINLLFFKNIYVKKMPSFFA